MTGSSFTSHGETFDLRPLTRGELKTLRKQGYNMGALTTEQADDAMDAVFAMVLGDDVDRLDAMPNTVAIDVWKKILSLTYGRDPEKNS